MSRFPAGIVVLLRQRGLPHAKREDFICFGDDTANGRLELFWDDEILASPARKIAFDPVKFEIRCFYDENNGCVIKSDVTWTVWLPQRLLCSATLSP